MIEALPEYRALRRHLGAAFEKQLPFACAKSLTELAKMGHAAVLRELPHKFTIRNSWTAKGVRFRPAEKRDWPDVQSIVGDVDRWAPLQELGGIKRPDKHARLAIPTRLARTGGSNRGLLPKRWWAGQAIEAGRATRKDDLVWRKRVRGGSDQRRLLYLLRPQAQQRPRWHFRETVTAEVEAHYAPVFTRNIEAAMKTARPG